MFPLSATPSLIDSSAKTNNNIANERSYTLNKISNTSNEVSNTSNEERKKCPGSFLSVALANARKQAFSGYDENNKIARDHFTNTIEPFIVDKKNSDRKDALNQIEKYLGGCGQDSEVLLERFINEIEAALCMVNVSSESLKKFETGFLLNLSEVYDCTVGSPRADFENGLFYINGYPSTTTMLNYIGKKVGSKPTYGWLERAAGQSGSQVYGDTTLFLKSNTKKYMTFTPGDSAELARKYGSEPGQIGKYVAVSGNLYPLIAGANEHQILALYNNEPLLPYQYFEWQSHGAIYFNRDIEYITYKIKSGRTCLAEIENFARRNGLVLKHPDLLETEVR